MSMLQILDSLKWFGIDIRRMWICIRQYPAFKANIALLKRKIDASDSSEWSLDSKIVEGGWCIGDNDQSSGVASGIYFHQDILVAKKIYERNPVLHIDVGSRVDTLIAHLSVFRCVEVFDIRGNKQKVKNIRFTEFDATKKLHAKYINYADSISSTFAIGHFGLGRYGDKIDLNGHKKGLLNLYKMLKKNGYLYLSVPIGPQKIVGNCHRIFSITTILSMLSGKFIVCSFSYIDDYGDLHTDQDFDLKNNEVIDNYGCKYGSGIFECRKIV